MYNPFGQRILKIVKQKVAGNVQPESTWKYYYYAYDANGQVMATYEVAYATYNTAKLDEQMIYGQSRLGYRDQNKLIYTSQFALPAQGDIYTNTLGKKRYELTNHLGNVVAVVSDRKMVDPDYVAGSSYDFTSSGPTWNTGGCAPTLTVTGGKQVVTTAACTSWISRNEPVVPGKTYTFTMDIDRSAIAGFTLELYLAGTSTGPELLTLGTWTNLASGQFTYTFTPVTGQNFVRVFLRKTSAEAGFFTVDNFKVTTVNTQYYAVILMKSDYYPFGMQMPGRNVLIAGDSYRFGYNGMEKDNEVKGNGNSYTTEFRQYDPRLGRWMSLDPLAAQFPDISPYVAFANNPILFTDPYGLAPTNDGPGDPPTGLPADPTHEQIGKADDGKEYQWVVGDNGEGSWDLYRGEVVVTAYSTQTMELNAYLQSYAEKGAAVVQAMSNSFNDGVAGGFPVMRVVGSFDYPEPGLGVNMTDSELGHLILDFIGMIPLLGEAADGINGIWYSVEGDYVNATISFGAMIPIGGQLVSGMRISYKMGDEALTIVAKTDDIADAIAKHGDEVVEQAANLKNGHLAGGVHPKTGVPFDANGYPNFADHLYKGGANDVMITPTGNRARDFAAANKAAGYKNTPAGYTWHHHQQKGRMQLVERGVHARTGHSGGYSLHK